VAAVKIARDADAGGYVIFVPDEEVKKFTAMWHDIWRAMTFGWPGEGRTIKTIHPPEGPK
jgi:hypothetical protein